MTRRISENDDSRTNPLYAVKVTVTGRVVPTRAAIKAADEAAKLAAERRTDGPR